MSEFSGYEKMSNSLKKLGLIASDFPEMEKLEWTVTEKIHGANFSFVYENKTLKYAKRKAYLSWEDDFFGFQLVVHQIEDQILALFEGLSTNIDAEKFIIYGELLGGEYPHPDTTADDNVQAIQTGVYYSPNIHFCAFDIAIETDETASKYYLDYKTTISYFERHEIFHATPLFIGKLGKALDFNTRIDSIIPEQLGLPALEENIIEGVVVKPFNQTNNINISTRPIIKIKNAEFEEEKRFHQAQKWTFIPSISSKTEELSFILDELRNYVTANRLDSAISKIGALDINNKQRMLDIKIEFLRDTLDDFNEDNDNLLEELSTEQQEWIKNRIKAEISKRIISFQ